MMIPLLHHNLEITNARMTVYHKMPPFLTAYIVFEFLRPTNNNKYGYYITYAV